MEPESKPGPETPSTSSPQAARDSAASISREAQITQSNRDLDRLAEEYHARLPRDQATAVGVAYARYSTDKQRSIVDQVRSLYDFAIRERIFIPRDHICFDVAVRGAKSDRHGLVKAKEILASRQVQVFLAFSTSRLFRKVYKALQFVEVEIFERGIRGVFLESNIDTAKSSDWRLLLPIHSITDEQASRMYAGNIRAGQVGRFNERVICGALPFGFHGLPIEGRVTRRGHPMKRIEIDPEAASWVIRIFEWFSNERMSIRDIVRRLRDTPGIPLRPHSGSGQWDSAVVRRLLGNERYRGLWQYGVTEAQWSSTKDYTTKVVRPEPLQSHQWEDLRIISEELWFRAQRRLATHVRNGGRKPKDPKKPSSSRALSGLFYCPLHNRTLQVWGTQGRSLICKSCLEMHPDQRPLFTYLNRALALRRICEVVASLIRSDENLVQQVVTNCQREAEALQRPDPSRLVEIRALVQRLGTKIQFLQDNVGETEEDQRETAVKLRTVRRERADLQSQIDHLESAQARHIAVPTEAEIQDQLARMAATLEQAARDGGPTSAATVREIVELITGGRIDLEQQGECRSHGGWLQGRFRLHLVEALTDHLLGFRTDARSDAGTEVLIDFRDPTEAESLAEKVKALWDQGLLIKEIAETLKTGRNLVAKALKVWADQHGHSVPDGRSRRKNLPRKQRAEPSYVALCENVKSLADEGILLGEIAQRLNIHRDTVTKSLQHWHASRGLAVPDGRARRKTLVRKSTRPHRRPQA